MSDVDFVVARGRAHPERVGRFGWSCGDYVTMSTYTQTDRFKAILPRAGLPDLYSIYAQSDLHCYQAFYFASKTPARAIRNTGPFAD